MLKSNVCNSKPIKIKRYTNSSELYWVQIVKGGKQEYDTLKNIVKS